MEVSIKKVKTIDIYSINIAGKDYEFTCGEEWEGMKKLKNEKLGVMIVSSTENVLGQLLHNVFNDAVVDEQVLMIKASPAIIEMLNSN